MKTFKNTLLLLAMAVLPAFCFAQPEICKVTFTGKQPTIKDFARAYCSQFENDSYERDALAELKKGNSNVRTAGGCIDCVVDTKNGYVSYTTTNIDGDSETMEMCYWNCDNKNEKIVAVNRISTAMGFDESFLTFYRYNVKTKTMRLIEAPFDRDPDAIDLIDQEKADKATVDMVLNSRNEDSNKYQPSFRLPRTGKDITYRMADQNAIPKEFQKECKLIWDGNGFCPLE
ncbi:MAG: hypothetical protein IK100_08205 [Muribaculaceae bacterium]|nr:hypothetical protein [Muribaculaceae bacterium]